MKELITEVLALHQTMQSDRTLSDNLKAERDRLAQSHDAMASRCQRLQSEAARLQQMLTVRNAALSEELGLQAAYNKCLSELSGTQSQTRPRNQDSQNLSMRNYDVRSSTWQD